MWPKTQELRPKGRSAAQSGDQLLHLPVLRFRVAASDNRPESPLGENSNLFWLVESKERVSDLIRQSQQVHDLCDARAGKAPSFRDLCHAQIGVGFQQLLPLHGQTDRMLHRRCRHHLVRNIDLESVDASDGIGEGMGDERLSAPS